MYKQLTLLPYKKEWKLTRKEKEAGLRGITKARAALAANKPRS